MMSRWTGWLTLVIALGAAGCVRTGGCEDCGGLSAAVSCEVMCERRAGQCGMSASDCHSTCTVAEAISERLGCGAEAGASRGCWARYAEVCGEDLASVCAPEDEALTECSYRGCGEHPDDLACKPLCVAGCEERARTCGGTTTHCEMACDAITSSAQAACASEFWAALACLRDPPPSACSGDPCPSEAAALRACVEAAAPPAPALPPYSACSPGDTCTGGTCATLETPSTSGSMCTVACETSADCPELDVHCVTFPGSSGGQCVRACYDDYDCAPGTYCFSYGGSYGCIPDV